MSAKDCCFLYIARKILRYGLCPANYIKDVKRRIWLLATTGSLAEEGVLENSTHTCSLCH